MRRRKGQLLDILRQQREAEARQKAAGKLPPAPPAVTPAVAPPAPAPAPSPPPAPQMASPQPPALPKPPAPPPPIVVKAPPAREPVRDTARDAAPGPRPALAMGGRPSGPKPGALLPWVPLVLVGILAVPLVLWLAKRFGGDEPKPGTNPPAVPAGTSQDPGRAAAPPPVEAVQKGPVHAVVAISYDYNDRQKQLALQTRDQLIRDGFPNVVLLAVPAARPSHYVIYVGEAAEAGTLVPLRDRLRQHSVPGQPGAKPFEKAYVQKRPTIGTP